MMKFLSWKVVEDLCGKAATKDKNAPFGSAFSPSELGENDHESQ
ncbi:hypothetical protein [Devosia chinhatensis]|nr:hypothetical protein [Devosia chinhatensis]